MVYLTGDTHAEFTRFSTKLFPEQKEMTKDDIVIILGDFGGIWKDSSEERYWLDWLNDKSFTTVFVDGNHENYDRLYSDEFKIVNFHGGKAHKIRKSVFHLMRGYVFDFEEKKFFCMGGASSHDIQDGILNVSDYSNEREFAKVYNRMTLQRKMFRVNHFSWWKQELPSQEEMDFGKATLKNNHNEVDYVISHCLPQEIASIVGYYGNDKETMYFNSLLQDGLKFKEWHCGHYHKEDRIMSNFFIHYKNIERLI